MVSNKEELAIIIHPTSTIYCIHTYMKTSVYTGARSLERNPAGADLTGWLASARGTAAGMVVRQSRQREIICEAKRRRRKDEGRQEHRRETPLTRSD
jgi:hypothetical protein